MYIRIYNISSRSTQHRLLFVLFVFPKRILKFHSLTGFICSPRTAANSSKLPPLTPPPEGIRFFVSPRKNIQESHSLMISPHPGVGRHSFIRLPPVRFTEKNSKIVFLGWITRPPGGPRPRQFGLVGLPLSFLAPPWSLLAYFASLEESSQVNLTGN